MVLRMFEELGMPILHIGKCEDCSLNYFWESIPTESYFASCTDEQINATDFESCNTDTLYPVDVWLYDHRVRDTINNEDFAVVFPDRAILNGQYVEWPIGGRKLTPRHAIEILNSVGPVVAGADRIHDETVCVAGVDVTSTEHRQSGNGKTKGAGAGEYACYNTDYHNTKYFQGCSTEKETGDSNISGACYDMTAHQCSCDPGSCNAELCKAQNGIWSAQCPNHCSSECQSNGGGDDTNAQDTTTSPVDIPSTAIAAGSFTTLVAALTAADLVSAIAEPNGPFTVFAPTDDAFAALPAGLVECLLEPDNKGALSAILTYHVVDGQVLSTDLTDGMMAPTLQGEDVTINTTDGVVINDSATVTTADITTSNGVIHVINAVLVPPSIDVAAFLATCGDDTDTSTDTDTDTNGGMDNGMDMDMDKDEESSSSSLYGSIVGLTIIAGVSALL